MTDADRPDADRPAASAAGAPAGAPRGPIRVFLVDDQSLVRAGFSMVIAAQPDMVVVGEAGDGDVALERLATTAADVVVMDIRMPALDGVEATRQLLARPAHPGPTPRVLVLTTFDIDEYAFAALKAGASGFMLKDAGPAELLAGIRAVHSGEAVVAPSTTRRLLDQLLPSMPDRTAAAGALGAAGAAATGGGDARLSVLTSREREVLEAVGRGLSNQEIAAEFFVAEATVKTHIGRVLHKLDLRDRVHMVITAYECGLAGRD